MARNYSKELKATIESALLEDSWNYYFSEKWGIFHFNLSLENINQIIYMLSVGKKSFTVRAYAPMNVPKDNPERMRQMKDFITLVNRHVLQGHFELNCETGEILFRAYVDCEEIVPSTEMIENSIMAAASSFEFYGKGILDILFGDEQADKTFAQCEENGIAKGAIVKEKDRVSEVRETFEMMSRVYKKLGLDMDISLDEIHDTNDNGIL